MNREREKVALVIGGSRGIGRQVAIDLSKSNYYTVVAAKTSSDEYKTNPFPPDPNSPQSTINTVVREIKEAGDALALPVDVRDFASITQLVDETVRQLGSLDVLVYNSGAIWWVSVEDTPMKRFQLMQRVNPEGLFHISNPEQALSLMLAMPVRIHTSCIAALAKAGLECADHCRFTSNILTFLSWKDSLRDG